MMCTTWRQKKIIQQNIKYKNSNSWKLRKKTMKMLSTVMKILKPALLSFCFDFLEEERKKRILFFKLFGRWPPKPSLPSFLGIFNLTSTYVYPQYLYLQYYTCHSLENQVLMIWNYLRIRFSILCYVILSQYLLLPPYYTTTT